MLRIERFGYERDRILYVGQILGEKGSDLIFKGRIVHLYIFGQVTPNGFG